MAILNANMAGYLRATTSQVSRTAALGTIGSRSCARLAPLLQHSIGMFVSGWPDSLTGVARLL